MTWLDVVLGALATYRLTRLATDDTITDRLRRRLIETRAATFVECPWCVSIWIGAGVALAAWQADGAAWFRVPAAALTFSAVAGWLAVHK